MTGVKKMGVYEDTLEDIERTFGTIPGFMRLFPRESLIHDWPSWKRDNPGELELERARFLLNENELLEEMLSKTQQISGFPVAGYGRKARTVCCGVLVDADRAPIARTMTGEQFLVCNDECRRFVEAAAPEQIRKISNIKPAVK